jgi:RNA recognition motif-containing protein
MFSAYGSVKATKVISDRAGVSKGYGFVTFETEEEAKRLVEIVSSLLLICVAACTILLLQFRHTSIIAEVIFY